MEVVKRTRFDFLQFSTRQRIYTTVLDIISRVRVLSMTTMEDNAYHALLDSPL